MGPEGIIKKQICDYLERVPGIFFWINQASKNTKFKSRFKRNGAPDLLGVVNKGQHKGKILALEIKAPGGSLSFDQINFLEQVHKHGGLHLVAYSLDDVINFINSL